MRLHVATSNRPAWLSNVAAEFDTKGDGWPEAIQPLLLHAASADSSWLSIVQLRDVTEKLVVVGGGDPLSVEAQRNATMLFKIHLRATLAAKRVLNDHRLSADAYEWVLGEVAERFMKVRTPEMFSLQGEGWGPYLGNQVVGL